MIILLIFGFLVAILNIYFVDYETGGYATQTKSICHLI